MIDQQFWFNLYARYVVSLLAQSLLAWELGKIGITQIFKKRPSGKVILAFILFLIQGVWGRVSGLEVITKSVYDFWPLAVAVGVYLYASSRRSVSNDHD
jgi:hypothetical protein